MYQPLTGSQLYPEPTGLCSHRIMKHSRSLSPLPIPPRRPHVPPPPCSHPWLPLPPCSTPPAPHAWFPLSLPLVPLALMPVSPYLHVWLPKPPPPLAAQVPPLALATAIFPRYHPLLTELSFLVRRTVYVHRGTPLSVSSLPPCTLDQYLRLIPCISPRGYTQTRPPRPT